MFEFEIKWYNEEILSRGFVAKTSFKEAMDFLIENFGEEEICECKLKFLTDDSVIYYKDEAHGNAEEYFKFF